MLRWNGSISECIGDFRNGTTRSHLTKSKLYFVVTPKFPSDVEIAIGDLLDPLSVAEALRGMDKLFLLNAATADELTQALIALPG